MRYIWGAGKIQTESPSKVVSQPEAEPGRTGCPTSIRGFKKLKFLMGEIPSSMTKAEQQQMMAARERVLGRRLEQVARDNSGDNPVLAEVLLMHLHYNWGKGNNPRTPRMDKPQVVNGVKFWRVGHNASHEFYGGTDGSGKRFRYSVGESCTVDTEGRPLEEDGIPGIDEYFAEVANFYGYLGHF